MLRSNSASTNDSVDASLGKSALSAESVTAGTWNVYDPGLSRTAFCRSEITYIDGVRGILLYRGYPADKVASSLGFLETSLLLINGELPDRREVDELADAVRRVGENVFAIVDPLIRACPDGLAPMGVLGAAVGALSGVAETGLPDRVAGIPREGVELLAAAPYLVAHAFGRWRGRPVPEARPDLGYAGNFLRMSFGVPGSEDEPDPELVQALTVLLILHADHELNCSTATMRMVGSAGTGFFGAASAAVNALSGPLHGGANQAVIQMLHEIHDDGGDVDKYVARAKDRTDEFRLMGFGHRVYKTTDARVSAIKDMATRFVRRYAADDPLLEIALRLEEIALTDDYFVSRNLYPNVDFYSGLLYKAMGFPAEMFTPLFVLGRIPGWIAHWKEASESQEKRICRPAQVYVGVLSRELS